MTTTDEDWIYSDELEELILDLIFPNVLKLHTNNKRPSTEAKHQKGLTRLQRDQGGEKKEKRMRYSGGNKRRTGLIVLIPFGYIGPLSFNFKDYPYIEIDVNIENDGLEVFIPFTPVETHRWQQMFTPDLEELSNEIEVAWVDFHSKKYFWIKLRNTELKNPV